MIMTWQQFDLIYCYTIILFYFNSFSFFSFHLVGVLYHKKDTQFHKGRDIQLAALDAFDRALQLDGDNTELIMQVHQSRGDKKKN